MGGNNFQYLFNNIGYKRETDFMRSGILGKSFDCCSQKKKGKKFGTVTLYKQDCLHTFLIIQVFKTIP